MPNWFDKKLAPGGAKGVHVEGQNHLEAQQTLVNLERQLREYVEYRVQLGVQQAIAYAAERADQLAVTDNGILQHLPAFLNAVATVPALAQKLAVQGGQLTAAINEIGKLASKEKQLAEATGEIGNLWKAIQGTTSEIGKLASKEKQLAEATGEIGNLWKASQGTTSEIGKLWTRLEFVRNEILYEIQYSSSRAASKAPGIRKPRIVNAAALSPAGMDGLKINIGCGHVPVAGYVNIDARELGGVDVIADVGDLPFEKGGLVEIFSAHLLEHFPDYDLRRLLPYWKTLLRPGGVFRAIVPDGEAMLAGMIAGSYSFNDFRVVLFGGQEYEGNFHFNMFTPGSLAEMLQGAGFRDVTVPVKGRKNGNCFEFEIVSSA